jgi:very-short-patch-repair endonuclease
MLRNNLLKWKRVGIIKFSKNFVNNTAADNLKSSSLSGKPNKTDLVAIYKLHHDPLQHSDFELQSLKDKLRVLRHKYTEQAMLSHLNVTYKVYLFYCLLKDKNIYNAELINDISIPTDYNSQIYLLRLILDSIVLCNTISTIDEALYKKLLGLFYDLRDLGISCDYNINYLLEITVPHDDLPFIFHLADILYDSLTSHKVSCLLRRSDVNDDFFKGGEDSVRKLVEFMERNGFVKRNLKRCYKMIKIYEIYILENLNCIRDIQLLEKIIRLLEDANKGSENFYLSVTKHFIALHSNVLNIPVIFEDYIICFWRVFNIAYSSSPDYDLKQLLINFLSSTNMSKLKSLDVNTKCNLLKMLSLYDINSPYNKDLLGDIKSTRTTNLRDQRNIILTRLLVNDIPSVDKVQPMETDIYYSNWEVKIYNLIKHLNPVRQKKIGPFTIDYFIGPNICIDVNGPYHFIGDTAIYSTRYLVRKKILTDHGYKVISIPYKSNDQKVLSLIENFK